MSAPTPYFVLSGQPGNIHVTLHGKNGERVWWTEGYTRRRTAYAAIELLCGPTWRGWMKAEWEERPPSQATLVWHRGYEAWLPVRDEVAKRRTSAPTPRRTPLVTP